MTKADLVGVIAKVAGITKDKAAMRPFRYNL